MKEKDRNELFPVFLKPNRLRVLIVGGGNVGHEKLSALLTNCPDVRVTVVSKAFGNPLLKLAAQFPGVKLRHECFNEQHLSGINLVIVAVNDRNTSASIKKLAETWNILTNVADTPNLCDFYLGSIVQKGHLKIAISTNGKSPTLAKRLREMFAEIIPENISDLLKNLHAVRNSLDCSFREKVKILDRLTRGMIE